VNERDDRERQLQGQHHLGKHQKITRGVLAKHHDGDDGGDDGQGAGEQTPRQGPHPKLHEAFHHDLTGQRPGDGGGLAGGDERHREGVGAIAAQDGLGAVRVLYVGSRTGRLPRECAAAITSALLTKKAPLAPPNR
jgi:hypothetical protein